MTTYDRPYPNDASPRDFLQNREHLLTRVVSNNARWADTMQAIGNDPFLTETWIDGEGVEHRVVITPSFLVAQFKIQRSLVFDLQALGEEGRSLADRILLEQRDPFQPATPYPQTTLAPDDA